MTAAVSRDRRGGRRRAVPSSRFVGDPARRRGLVVLTKGGSGFGVYQRLVRAATGLDQLSFVADLHPPHA